jgi:hypothetical protein
LTLTAFRKTVDFYKRLIVYGKYTINGQEYKVPLHKAEIEADNKLAIYLLVDHQSTGTVTRAQLFDVHGELFDEKIVNIEKDDIQGVLIKFAYEIKEV